MSESINCILTKIKYLSFLVLSLLSLAPTWAQTEADSSHSILSSLNAIQSTPVSITFKNNLEVNNDGGHLQGIQILSYKEIDYYVLSGSSAVYSYYAIVKSGKENMVVSINKILEAPFNHAGGFQIWENLMAVGVEDMVAKNKSKVFIFEIENPEKPPQKPLAIIERFGTFKRATAGCAGITVVDDKVLVVIGDWDSDNLDFYRIDREKLFEEGATLELEYSLNIKKQDKSGWIDQIWRSYQNINFIKAENGNLYLAGMTSSKSGENVIDLFLVEAEDLSTFKLQKIYTRTFNENDKTKFIWGAGVSINAKQQISILSTSENIQNESAIHIYK